jgi:hypothetical protein
MFAHPSDAIGLDHGRDLCGREFGDGKFRLRTAAIRVDQNKPGMLHAGSINPLSKGTSKHSVATITGTESERYARVAIVGGGASNQLQ